MKKNSLLIALVALGLMLSFVSFAAGAPAAGDKDGGKRWLAHVSPQELKTLAAKGCVEVRDIRTAHAIKCPASADLTGVDAVEDPIAYAMDLNADKQIRADLVWGMGFNGTGRVIAVLDTGIDYRHAELAGSYLGGYDFVNKDADPMDDNGHGTHVSGIITANGVASLAKGVAPGVGIVAGKVLDSKGSGYFSDIIAGIYWAADNTSADAISMSLGTSQVWKNSNCDSSYPDLTAAIAYAVSKGKSVVAASGNTPGGVSMPGCISYTITVGAVDSKDVIASFSGRGYSMKDHGVVAPGVSIYSSWLNGGYAYASGTSMATPHVSAVIALMKHKNAALTPAQVKNILFTTSKDLGTKGADTTYGKGRVDAYAAVKAS